MTSMRNIRKKAREDERREQELKEQSSGNVLDFDESEFVVVADQRKGGKRVVSVNPNLGRIVIYRTIYEEMEKAWGGKFDHVLLLIVERIPGKFWVRPCTDTADGKKKIHKTAETRMISAKMLITKLDLGIDETTQYKAIWDKNHNALMVDVSSPA
jgi:hypothetical protein